MSTPERHKQIRAERKAAGLCVGCGKRPPLEGRVNCEECLRRTNQYQRQYRVERKEWGRCIECGKKPPFEGRVRCEDCLCRDLLTHHNTKDSDTVKENRKKRREERKAVGLCITCGKPTYKEYVRCYECHIRNRRGCNEYRRQHNTGRIKPWNTPPPPRKQSVNHPWNQMNKLIKRRDKTQ